MAPVRALVQRLGPHVEDVEPVAVRTGETVDRDELVARLVALGYRREYQVEARGEVAVRGSIVDVYPVTDDHPVRVDLWGDDVERLSAFSVADQRSTHDLDDVLVFPARELLATAEVRDRAAALVRTARWGAEQWERLADGQHFDGMESWLPWLTPDERLLPDLLDDDALVLVCEPTRLRDRAQELVDEEEALAATLAQTWGASGTFPRLSLPFERVLAHTRGRARRRCSPPPRARTPPTSPAPRSRPSPATPTGSPAGSRTPRRGRLPRGARRRGRRLRRPARRGARRGRRRHDARTGTPRA